MFRSGHRGEEPRQGALHRLARRVGAGQTFREGELAVVVAKLRATDDEPSVTNVQLLQTLQVPSPGIVVDELRELRGGVVAESKPVIRRDSAQAIH